MEAKDCERGQALGGLGGDSFQLPTHIIRDFFNDGRNIRQLIAQLRKTSNPDAILLGNHK